MNVTVNINEALRQALLAELRDVADPNGSPGDVVTVLLDPSGMLAKDTREGASGSPMVTSGTLAFAVAVTSIPAMERLLTLTTSSPFYGMIYGCPVGVTLTDGIGEDLTILTQGDYTHRARERGLPRRNQRGASPGAVEGFITRTGDNFVDTGWRLIDYDGSAEIPPGDIRRALAEAMPELGRGAAIAYRSSSHRARRNSSKWHIALRIGAASRAGRGALKSALERAQRALETAGHAGATIDATTLSPIQLVACGGPRVPEASHLDAGLQMLPPADGETEVWSEVDVDHYAARDDDERRRSLEDRNWTFRERRGIANRFDRRDRWPLSEAALVELFQKAEPRQLHHQEDLFPLIAATLWAWGLERERERDAVYEALREYVVAGRKLRHPDLRRDEIVGDFDREWKSAQPDGRVGGAFLVARLHGRGVFRPTPAAAVHPDANRGSRSPTLKGSFRQLFAPPVAVHPDANRGLPLADAEVALQAVVREALSAPGGSTTLIKATEGLGKSREAVAALSEILRADPSLLVVYAVPTRTLGDQVVEALRASGESARRWRTYDEPAEDRKELMCLRPQFVFALREAKLPIKPNACERPAHGETPASICRLAKKCSMTVQRAARPNVLVVTHAALFNPTDIWRDADILIADESFVAAGFDSVRISTDWFQP